MFIRIDFKKSLCSWVWRSAPELLAFNDAHGHVVWVVAGGHDRVGSGKEAPVHSLGVNELNLVDSGKDDLDVIRNHVLCCDTYNYNIQSYRIKKNVLFGFEMQNKQFRSFVRK